jgi:hypothetical protein
MKLLVILVWLVSTASYGYAITIVQPENNSIFLPGQKVKVVVSVTDEEKASGLFIYTYKGSSELLEKGQYETELTLDTVYVGKGFIKAVAKIPSEIHEASVDIIIQLPQDVKLEKIVVDKYESIIKAASGKPLKARRLQTSGLFSDGVKRDLDIVSGLQFASSDLNVVTVDSKGILTALNLGKATISIVAGDKSETVDVKVYVVIKLDKELLVKPVETGIQLDWKLSPQDPEWVTGYMVFRTEDPDGVIKRKIADVPNGTTTYIDTTAVKGKTYYYGVQAISATANERSSMTNMTPGVLP